MKQKIIIVNNNLLIGGIQKALVEMIKKIHNDYDVTLLLFKKNGKLISEIPDNVKIIETKSAYKYMGIHQSEWRGIGKYIRAFFVLLTRAFGFGFTSKILNMSLKKSEVSEHFDLAISYMQNSSKKSFYGGTADYTLNLNADKKLQFIHCDYKSSGTACKHNEIVYKKYDKIVCVSESVKKTFNEVIPELTSKTDYLYNAIDEENVIKLADENSFSYDSSYINFISVARLSPEKGIDRAIEAFAMIKDECNFRYYVVGDGMLRAELEERVKNYGLSDRVYFMGEQENPYRYMKGADYLLVPSLHEAAPVVFAEAKVLNLPVITTATISANELIGEDYGIVTENSVEGIIKGLLKTSAFTKQTFKSKASNLCFREEFKTIIK